MVLIVCSIKAARERATGVFPQCFDDSFPLDSKGKLTKQCWFSESRRRSGERIDISEKRALLRGNLYIPSKRCTTTKRGNTITPSGRWSSLRGRDPTLMFANFSSIAAKLSAGSTRGSFRDYAFMPSCSGQRWSFAYRKIPTVSFSPSEVSP